MAAPLKVCLVGPARTGKTLLSKVLAEQSVNEEPEYNPTAGVRIQEVSRTVKNERVKVQIWDCAGSSENQQYWPVLARGLDGVILAYDPSQPQHEAELEKLYTTFAQPSRLTTSQCMTLAIKLSPSNASTGLQGKLQKLQRSTVDLSPENMGEAHNDGMLALDQLLEGCVARRRQGRG